MMNRKMKLTATLDAVNGSSDYTAMYQIFGDN
jgi:hypothetical protein